VKLAAFDAESNVVFQVQPIRRTSPHVRVEDLLAVSAEAFARYDGGVRIAEDVFGRTYIPSSSTPRQCWPDEQVIESPRWNGTRPVPECATQSDGLGGVAELIQQNRELVASEPGNHVATTEPGVKPLGERDEQLMPV